MTTERTPRVDETKPARTITMRRHSWDPESTIEVTLRPHRYKEDDVEVFVDGEWIGTVGSYTGSLDRPAGRLRIPGKSRTLWHEAGTYPGARVLHGYVSRAEAIRRLLRD